MSTELIQLSFDKIMQTRSYTVIVLSARDKSFAIYTEPNTGRILQSFLTEVPNPRPMTHELVSSIFQGLELRVKQVVINDVQDTIYFARLFLEQEIQESNMPIRHIIEIDIRPSDGLIFALMSDAPVFCTKKVLDETIPVQE